MAFLISLMSYFEIHRNKASGLLSTIIAIKPIVMPLTIHYTQQSFGPTGCLVLFAGLCFHTMVASLLLQPVKWHMKTVPSNEIRLMPVEAVAENKASKLRSKAVLSGD